MRDGAALGGVLSFGFDRNRVAPKDVELAVGQRLRVHLPALRGTRDLVEHSSVSDSRLGVVGDELVPVCCDADPRIAWFLDHDSREASIIWTLADFQSGHAEQMSTVSSGP